MSRGLGRRQVEIKEILSSLRRRKQPTRFADIRACLVARRGGKSLTPSFERSVWRALGRLLDQLEVDIIRGRGTSSDPRQYRNTDDLLRHPNIQYSDKAIGEGARVKQLELEIAPEACDADWIGMPAYDHADLSPTRSIVVNFRNQEDFDRFEVLVEQEISETKKSIWYPKVEIVRYANKRYVSDRPLVPKYPIYIVFKGRWEKPLTAMQLEAFGTPYRIVVEPQEYEHYSKVIDPEKILKLPFSNLGQGSIPARNWIWEHAIETGAKRHWILDDNLYMFLRFNKNLKVPVSDGTIFAIAENKVDCYDNVAIAGFNYIHFIERKKGNRYKPFRLNTRIYSCILIQNDIPYRWRGKYNEDTDLSIRVLKDGWCTLLFNAFLADKTTTMRMAGGNTDELYAGGGAAFSPFKNNALKPAKNPPEPLDGRDDYGFRLIEWQG